MERFRSVRWPLDALRFVINILLNDVVSCSSCCNCCRSVVLPAPSKIYSVTSSGEWRDKESQNGSSPFTDTVRTDYCMVTSTDISRLAQRNTYCQLYM